MALNIKNPKVEQLAAEVAEITGESKTEAIRQALAERRQRLASHRGGRPRGEAFVRFLEQDVWPCLPASARGRRLTRSEEDDILGYGPEGV